MKRVLALALPRNVPLLWIPRFPEKGSNGNCLIELFKGGLEGVNRFRLLFS